MTPVDEVRELIDELVGGMTDEVVQTRKNEDGSATSYVVHTRKSLLGRVHDLLEPGAVEPRDRHGKGGKKQPTAPLPVATDAFNVLVIVESAVREIESLLRHALGLPASFDTDPRGVHRPHSFAHTAMSMRAVEDLFANLATAHPDHLLVAGHGDPDQPKVRKPGRVLREVRSWHRQASTIVGFRQEWARLRYVAVAVIGADGKTTSRLRRVGCPYCGSTSLKQRPRDGAVLCCNPKCKTPTDTRAEWPAEELERLGLVLTAEKKPEGETA